MIFQWHIIKSFQHAVDRKEWTVDSAENYGQEGEADEDLDQGETRLAGIQN